MAKRASLNLDTLKAVKLASLAVAPAPAEAATPTRSNDDRKGQTLRLSVDAWKQLKHLAVDENKSAHELMTEAINMLFRDRGRPPIA